ncbi:Os03g0725300 [Oryza sativa Japonica Group]|uniref:Os03g0725300 protein n=1 Tax=Oryza sativa subsp. japonica TaxID=39947 RepID=A0A0P0W316_ORYSJ|nr:hypothetical protein EE612_020157 [Oryza sativa]BAS86166.1 Os03g0725300 [Oryza sativa Japonica Group]
MKIAVEGCMHGELDKVYDTLRELEKAEGVKIDLLLCCGDFQAVRNENDLQCLNVKPRFREMKSFWKYYSGQAVAPYPTSTFWGSLVLLSLETFELVDYQEYISNNIIT